MSHHYKMQLIPKFVNQHLPNTKPPIIEIKSNDTTPTFIGRSAKTQIKATLISRKLLKVEISNTGAMSIFMQKPPDAHSVTLDGEKINAPVGVRVPIYPGSVVSLHNDQFRYDVKLFDTVSDTATSNPQCPGTNVNALTTTSNDSKSLNKEEATEVIKSIKSTMMDELICSICMNVIWKASLVVPCKHLYCKSCIEQVCTRANGGRGSCPKCRGPVKQIVEVPHTDTMIFCMIRAGEFDADDTQDFLERSGKRLTKTEVSSIFLCIFLFTNVLF